MFPVSFHSRDPGLAAVSRTDMGSLRSWLEYVYIPLIFNATAVYDFFFFLEVICGWRVMDGLSSVLSNGPA